MKHFCGKILLQKGLSSPLWVQHALTMWELLVRLLQNHGPWPHQENEVNFYYHFPDSSCLVKITVTSWEPCLLLPPSPSIPGQRDPDPSKGSPSGSVFKCSVYLVLGCSKMEPLSQQVLLVLLSYEIQTARELNSSENLAPKQAAPGMVFPGERCTLTSAQELLNGRGKFLV